MQQPPRSPAASAVPAAAAEPASAGVTSRRRRCRRFCPGPALLPSRGPDLPPSCGPDPAGAPRPCPTSSGLPTHPPLVSLFDLTFGASAAPAATADSVVRSQWTTRDAAARLAIRSHLPSAERAHFSQYKTTRTLYNAVVARYSSPATAALSRLMLPYLFPDLAAFATVTDLITHLRTSDTRYRAALPAEFCTKNPPPMYITLYYLVTRLPDSLCSVRDHFLSLCPTTLTVDLLEERLFAAEKSIVAVGASRGDPRAPFFEGCSPSPLLPSVASTAAVDLVGDRSGETCGGPHTTPRCFGRLTDTWSTQFPGSAEIPRWDILLKSGVAIFDLDFDVILAAMYAVSISAEGDCYLCVPPDLGIEAAALGASESTAPCAACGSLSG
ncbi:unnamed protein product [Closterium sp. NIES-65]|nr:unnamed protein product [Closterium sp. NIES-65]